MKKLFLILVVILLLCLSVASCYSSPCKIISLNIQSETSGQFILGCGSISGKLYYYFFRENNGGYLLDSSPVSRVTIYEDSTNETAYCEFTSFSHPYRVTKLHVPKGTIIREYNLEIK